MEKCICGEMDVWSSDIHHRRPESCSQGSQAMLRPQLPHSFLSSLKDAPPIFSPALLERRFPRKGRSSSWCGGHRRQGNAGLLGPTDYTAWGCRRPRGLGGSASSMDSLYVEEVAASLVREFLSRKVMAVHSEAQETALMVGGSLGFPVVPLHLRGWGSIPPLLFASDSPKSAPFSAIGKLHFPEASPS